MKIYIPFTYFPSLLCFHINAARGYANTRATDKRITDEKVRKEGDAANSEGRGVGERRGKKCSCGSVDQEY